MIEPVAPLALEDERVHEGHPEVSFAVIASDPLQAPKTTWNGLHRRVDLLATAGIVALVFLGGALSFIYMFQLYRARFWINEEADEATTQGALGLVVAIAFVIVAIGVFPEPLLSLSREAALVLPERAP